MAFYKYYSIIVQVQLMFLLVLLLARLPYQVSIYSLIKLILSKLTRVYTPMLIKYMDLVGLRKLI